MQSQYTRFRAAIVNNIAAGDERGQAGNRDNMALVLLDHVGKELLDQIEMADDVDVEEFAEGLVGAIEDRVTMCNPSIIDEYRGVALFRADSVGYL